MRRLLKIHFLCFCCRPQFCSSVEFMPASLLTVYGAAVSRRLSAAVDPQHQSATKRLSPTQARHDPSNSKPMQWGLSCVTSLSCCMNRAEAAGCTPACLLCCSSSQAVAQMEGETHVAIERLLETIPTLCGRGNSAALAPFILAAADASLVETLNGLSPRINTFHQSVAVKVGTHVA